MYHFPANSIRPRADVCPQILSEMFRSTITGCQLTLLTKVRQNESETVVNQVFGSKRVDGLCEKPVTQGYQNFELIGVIYERN